MTCHVLTDCWAARSRHGAGSTLTGELKEHRSQQRGKLFSCRLHSQPRRNRAGLTSKAARSCRAECASAVFLQRRDAGSLHEYMAHERLKAYVCVLHDSPCAPLLLPWLGEVEGTSLAMTQAKASPVPAPAPMFRVSPVLRRLPSAVPPTIVGSCAGRLGHWGFSVGVVDLLGGSHLYPRINFKRNRAAALAEWRQLLSA